MSKTTSYVLHIEASDPMDMRREVEECLRSLPRPSRRNGTTPSYGPTRRLSDETLRERYVQAEAQVRDVRQRQVSSYSREYKTATNYWARARRMMLARGLVLPEITGEKTA